MLALTATSTRSSRCVFDLAMLAHRMSRGSGAGSMLRRALRDVRLSGGSTMTAAEVSEVMRKIDPDTVAYREQYKAELINMMKQKEAEKKAEDEIKKGDDDEGDDRVSRALRT